MNVESIYEYGSRAGFWRLHRLFTRTSCCAMKAYPDLPADANVEAWLVTIAHRKAIDVTPRRRPPRDPRRHTDSATSPAPGDAVPDAAAELTQALAKLPASRNKPSPTTTSPGCPTPKSPAILGGSADAARRAAADGIAALRRSFPGAPALKGAPGEQGQAIP